MKINDSYVARRRFLCGMLGSGAAALSTSVGVPMAAYVGNLRREPPPEWIELDEEDWQLAPGESKIVMYGHIPALLMRTPEPQSTLRVFVAECTHFDCTVGYVAEENRIYCTCHEGYYDVDGRVALEEPAHTQQQCG